MLEPGLFALSKRSLNLLNKFVAVMISHERDLGFSGSGFLIGCAGFGILVTGLSSGLQWQWDTAGGLH